MCRVRVPLCCCACRSMVRHVLTNSPEMYGKGILAEIIEFIMGKVRARVRRALLCLPCTTCGAT